jgi:hypothetical protein
MGSVAVSKKCVRRANETCATSNAIEASPEAIRFVCSKG